MSLRQVCIALFLISTVQLDYTAGVLPVTHVDKALDRLPADFYTSEKYLAMSPALRPAYEVYDVEGMHGLPMGVQVVGRRLEEERVLEGMRVIEEALREGGSVYEKRVLV